jgi:SAM-dependent methyltransferase
MKSIISVPNAPAQELPEEFRGEDLRFSEELVEVFLGEYTKPGDKVIDIFSGYGTTLIVAERMDRIGYGIEIDNSRLKYATSRIQRKENLLHGDTRLIDQYSFPQMDFALCSPVYMNRKWNMSPLTNDTTPQTYDEYLSELQTIFAKLRRIVKVGGYIVIVAANFKSTFATTFAWDLCRAISSVLRFEHEIVVCWDDADNEVESSEYEYFQSYCLVFSNLALD